jgi:hypothetical protein
LLACKRLPIVGSVLTSLHAAETLFLKKPRRDQCHKGYQSGQNNRQVESPHSPLICLRPVDLIALHWSPFRRIDQSIGFHRPLLSDGKPRCSSKIS